MQIIKRNSKKTYKKFVGLKKMCNFASVMIITAINIENIKY